MAFLQLQLASPASRQQWACQVLHHLFSFVAWWCAKSKQRQKVWTVIAASTVASSVHPDQGFPPLWVPTTVLHSDYGLLFTLGRAARSPPQSDAMGGIRDGGWVARAFLLPLWSPGGSHRLSWLLVCWDCFCLLQLNTGRPVDTTDTVTRLKNLPCLQQEGFQLRRHLGLAIWVCTAVLRQKLM